MAFFNPEIVTKINIKSDRVFRKNRYNKLLVGVDFACEVKNKISQLAIVRSRRLSSEGNRNQN
ncbi:hypothetical protein [Chroococcidiopsis sp.]|uniref:hypothetical protein n=1 Tax=Chroococcidiopsis sp. TaxID=3088168 RepID=UPI003F3E4319